MFTNIVRLPRILKLLENPDALVLSHSTSPLQQLKLQGKQRWFSIETEQQEPDELNREDDEEQQPVGAK